MTEQNVWAVQMWNDCAAYKVDVQDVLDWISSHKLGDE